MWSGGFDYITDYSIKVSDFIDKDILYRIPLLTKLNKLQEAEQISMKYINKMPQWTQDYNKYMCDYSLINDVKKYYGGCIDINTNQILFKKEQ